LRSLRCDFIRGFDHSHIHHGFPVTLQLSRCSVRGKTDRGADPQVWGVVADVSNPETLRTAGRPVVPIPRQGRLEGEY